MIHLIKNFLGLRGQRRSQSAQHTSKLKNGSGEKMVRAPSLDSKQKLFQTQEKTKEECQTLFELDEVGTVKRSNRCQSKEYPQKANLNYDMVSDIDDQQSQNQQYDLLSNYSEQKQAHFSIPIEDRYVSQLNTQSVFTFISDGKKSKHVTVIQSNHGDSTTFGVNKETEAKTSLDFGKVFVKRELPKRRPLKVAIQCPFCSEPLEIKGSLKLACSHRFHQKCAMKMKQRNRYQCDLCEIKRKNLCSIILMDRKKQRGVTPPNKH